MTGVPVSERDNNGREIRWRLKRIEERLDEIEESEPKLMRYELDAINTKLSLLLKVVISIGISIVTGSILLALNLLQSR